MKLRVNLINRLQQEISTGNLNRKMTFTAFLSIQIVSTSSHAMGTTSTVNLVACVPRFEQRGGHVLTQRLASHRVHPARVVVLASIYFCCKHNKLILYAEVLTYIN